MELDQHFSWAKQSIFNITDDPFNKSVSYIKHDDFLKAFPEKTILVLQGPPGTQLDVPNPSEKDGKPNYQIHLKSKNGPVNVLFVNTEVNADEFYSNENCEPIDEMEVDEQSDGELEIVNSNHDEIRSPANKKQKTGDKTVVEKPAETAKSVVNTPDSSLRRLSPRKAAQQHLFVPSKRSSNQLTEKVVEEKTKAATTPNSTTKATPLNRRNSAAAAKQQQLTNSSSTKDKPEDEVSNIENNKPVQKKRGSRSTANSNQRLLNEDNIKPDIHQPLLRLSPPPSGRDYCFNLDTQEGALDLFGPHPLVEQNK